MMPQRSSRSVRISYPRHSRTEVIERLKAGVQALCRRLPVTRLVLFGSYAASRHTAASDIDVLVVYAGPPRPDAYAIVKKTLALRGLEPHVYTEAEAQAMYDMLERMTRGGVVIYDGTADRGSSSDQRPAFSDQPTKNER